MLVCDKIKGTNKISAQVQDLQQKLISLETKFQKLA